MLSNSDHYQLWRSTQDQSLDRISPFEKLDYGYIPDLNGGAYQNNAGVTQVIFDGSALYNSASMTDPSLCFFTVPLVGVGAYVSNIASGNLIAPAAGSEFQVGFKNHYLNLLNSADIKSGGQSVQQQQTNINFYNFFKVATMMSPADIENFGPSVGMSQLDNALSLGWNNNASTANYTAAAGSGNVGPIHGNGFVNNMPFSPANVLSTGGGDSGDQATYGAYGAWANGTFNNSLFKRMKFTSVPITNSTTATVNGLYGASTANAIASITTANKEFRNYYQVQNTYYQTWFTTAIIPLSTVCDFFDKAGICSKLDCEFRLYINTGNMAVYMNTYGNLGTPNGVNGLTGQNLAFSASNSTFTQTCPVMISSINTPIQNMVWEGGNSAAGAAFQPGYCYSLSIQKNQPTSFFNVNLGTNSYSHPMGSCRLYYPVIKMKPEKMYDYITNNRAKTIVYENQYVSNYNNITAGSNFSQVVQASVANLKNVVILPFSSASVNGLLNALGPLKSPFGQNGTGQGLFTPSVTSFADFASPFSCAPCQTGPISLNAVNVRLGQLNLKQDFINYGYESFLEELSKCNKINGGDFGITNGLISQYYWENAYRPYLFDCSRALAGDEQTPRSVQVMFNNNSLITIDIWVIVNFFDTAILDVQTGVIKKI